MLIPVTPVARRIHNLAASGVVENNWLFSSQLTGTMSRAPGQCRPSAAPCGSVTIDFDNTPVPFTFGNGNTTGSFLLAMIDLTIIAGATDVPLSAMITVAQNSVGPTTSVPEPGSLMIIGVGIAGLVARDRRSRMRRPDVA